MSGQRGREEKERWGRTVRECKREGGGRKREGGRDRKGEEERGKGSKRVLSYGMRWDHCLLTLILKLLYTDSPQVGVNHHVKGPHRHLRAN